MTYSRILFFARSYFKSNKRGMFGAYYETRKLYSIMPTLESRLLANVLLQKNIAVATKRLSSTKLPNIRERKNLTYAEMKTFNVFKHLKLEDLVRQPHHFNHSALLALFHKMCVVYHLNKHNKKFLLNLPSILKTEEFNAFCTLLEKYLTKLTPNALAFLLNLEYFKVPVNSPLMRKVLTLILDNLNCFSLFNVLEIYIQINEDHFKNSEECRQIKEACEVYFAKTFEDELSHCNLIEDLVFFLDEEKLPIYVKEIIANRIFEYLSTDSMRLQVLRKFFHFMFKKEFFTHFKDRTLELLKDILEKEKSPIFNNALIAEYQIVVCQDDRYYDESIYELVTKNIQNYENLINVVPGVHTLVLMGNFNEKLFQKVLDVILCSDFSKWKPSNALLMASLLARTNFHEMGNACFEKVQKLLLSYEAVQNFTEINNFVKWIEYLTFLGCDTRNLLNDISKINNAFMLKDLTNSDCRSLLQLHHFAESYFRDGYTKFSNEVLDALLRKASHSQNFYTLSCVKEFFGSEDYVLKNCTNSQKYFIPLVVILGSDNKPINLSSLMLSLEKSRINNIDNIPKPLGSKVIAFMGYNDPQPVNYRDAAMTSGAARIFQKSLEKFPYDVVLITVKFLKSSPEEKLKYLQSQIDEIIKKSNLQTSVSVKS